MSEGIKNVTGRGSKEEKKAQFDKICEFCWNDNKNHDAAISFF